LIYNTQKHTYHIHMTHTYISHTHDTYIHIHTHTCTYTAGERCCFAREEHIAFVKMHHERRPGPGQAVLTLCLSDLCVHLSISYYNIDKTRKVEKYRNSRRVFVFQNYSILIGHICNVTMAFSTKSPP